MHEIIKRDRVIVNASPAPQSKRVAGRGAGNAPAGGSTARVIQEEGRVVAVEITCACGDKTLLELDYE